MKSILSELQASVDWQGIEPYVTRKGKEKPLLTGIPTAAFWRLWKHQKKELKALSITVYPLAREGTGTGEFYQHKGVKKQKKSKQWQVQAWKPELIQGASEPEPFVPAENCPF